MKLYIIVRECGDGCSYGYTALNSIWTDEVKMLHYLAELQKRYPDTLYEMWDFQEIESDPTEITDETI